MSNVSVGGHLRIVVVYGCDHHGLASATIYGAIRAQICMCRHTCICLVASACKRDAYVFCSELFAASPGRVAVPLEWVASLVVLASVSVNGRVNKCECE